MKRLLTAVPALILTTALTLTQLAGPIIPIAFVGALAITQTACPKANDIAGVANEIAKDIDAALPVFRANGQDTTRLEQVKGYALKVRDAFKVGDTATAVETAALLIDAFDNEIVAQINRVTDPTVRTVLFVALVLGRRHLTDLAEKIAAAAPDELAAAAAQPARAARRAGSTGSSNPAATIQEFRKKKQWQCRASSPLENYKAGQYVPMTFCKKYPDNTQVETR